MRTLTRLPKDQLARSRVIRNAVDKGDAARGLWLFHTRLAMLYFAGFRRFQIGSMQDGRVDGHLIDLEGEYEYQSQDMLFELQGIHGFLNSIDLTPKIERGGSTLRDIRDRGVAQVVANNVLSLDDIKRVQHQFNWIYAAIGMCGLSGHVWTHPTIGMASDLEVVHPIELYPFPVVGLNPFDQAGFIRNRYISVKQLRGVYGARMVNKALEEGRLRTRKINLTDSKEVNTASTIQRSYPNYANLGPTGNAEDNESVTMVEVAECWVTGPSGLVTEYAVSSGDFEFQYEDLSNFEVYPSLQFARFYENGTFYGAGHFLMRWGSHRAKERVEKELFAQIREMRRNNILVVPSGTYNERTMFQDLGVGLKVMTVSPDPLGEEFRPFQLAVPNQGNLPQVVAQYATSAGERVNPIPDLSQEKGRIDSASGLRFLDESSRRSVLGAIESQKTVFSAVYRSVIQQAFETLTQEPQVFEVNRLTLDLAGVVVDAENRVQFPATTIPRMRKLAVGVAAGSASTREARRLEALDMLARGLTTPDQALTFMIMEGLDPAVYAEDQKNAIATVTKNILVLYGDGVTPGRIVFTPAMARPDVQLNLLNAFLSGEVAAVASTDVKTALIEYQQVLQTALGVVVPQQLPNPDDFVASLGESQ